MKALAYAFSAENPACPPQHSIGCGDHRLFGGHCRAVSSSAACQSKNGRPDEGTQ